MCYGRILALRFIKAKGAELLLRVLGRLVGFSENPLQLALIHTYFVSKRPHYLYQVKRLEH